MDHVDYPHMPGTLWDCLACETECHCDPSTGFVPCLSCAITGGDREEN